MMEVLRELSTEWLRDILDLEESSSVEARIDDPKHIACKAEEFIEVVVISSLLTKLLTVV